MTTGFDKGAPASGTSAFPTCPRVGVGAVIWRDDRVLLIRRRWPPRAGQWSLPGGRQELGETVEAALRREVFEETALQLGSLRLVTVVDLIEYGVGGCVAYHYTLIDYTADALPGRAIAGSDAAALDWFVPAALPELGLWSATLDVIDAARRLRMAR